MRSRSLSALRPSGWPAWMATCATFALLCAAIAYWAMIMSAPRPLTAPVATEQRALARLEQAAMLFGAPPKAGPGVMAASNLQVLGIVAAGRRGVAIVSVDGKPGKPFAVGDAVTPGQTIAQVRADAVVIDTGGRRAELPSPTRASLAVLTAGPARSGSGPGSAAGPTVPRAGMPTPSATQMPGAMSTPSAIPMPGAMPMPGALSGPPPAPGIVPADPSRPAPFQSD